MYDPQLTVFNTITGRWQRLKYELTKRDPYVDRQTRKIPVKHRGLKKIVIVRKEVK